MSFNGKGAVQGGAQGAAAGSSAGPWGAAIGAIGGAAIGAFASNSSSYKSYKYAKKLQQQAAALNYDYAQKSTLNSPSWNRAGLESAGYNPMLAVQNSTSGANSSWTSAGGSTGFDMSQGISAGVANAQSVQRLKNETQVAESSSKAQEATAENQHSQALNNIEENKYIAPTRKAQIAQITSDTAKKEAEIENMKKQIELGWAGVSLQKEANAIDRETRPSGRSQSFRNYTDGVRNIFSGFGDIIHGRSDNYENYTETREVTNGPKGRSSEKVTSKRSGRRKKR